MAARLGITRTEQDAFALNSQRKAIAAIDSGRFADEIVPVMVHQKKQEPIVFDTDEFPNRTTDEEKMAGLKPCFLFDGSGTVTAGSSSGRNDGASAVLLMAAEKAGALGLTPMVRVVSSAVCGIDPRIMGLGPVSAVRKALDKAGLSLHDIGLVELNEAFAAQSIGCIRELGIPEDIVNVNGGAIALGHPVGSSGCRILVTLIHEMKKRGTRYGLATLCIAGGMGQAIIVELCP